MADLSSFKCSKDGDIQSFLIKDAIPFEKAHKSRTYVLVDSEQLKSGRVVILAYFSIAMDYLLISDGVSKTFKRKLNGIFNDDTVPCYLIGQLARNDSCPKKDLTGEEILNYALNVLLDAQELVGGRFVRVDTRDHKELLSFYRENNFTLLPDKEEHGLCQLVRFITPK